MATNPALSNRSSIDNRYALTQVYVDDAVQPGVRRYGLWKPVALAARPEMQLPAGTYDYYTITVTDIGRLDLIAWRFYNDVNWWWVIALANHIRNQLTSMIRGIISPALIT